MLIKIKTEAAAILGTPSGRYPKTHAQLEPSDEEIEEKEEAEKKDKEVKESKPAEKKEGGKKEGEDSDDDGDSDDGDGEGYDSDDSDGEIDVDMKLDGEDDDLDDDDDEDSEGDEEGDADSSDDGDGDDDDSDSDSDGDDGDDEDDASEDEPKRVSRGRKSKSSSRIPRNYAHAAAVTNDIMVISGFPGTGKTTFAARNPGCVIDIDSSLFSRDDFPANYIASIKSRIVEQQKADAITTNPRKVFILVSTHTEVREALEQEGIPFYLVLPTLEQKEEYINRYVERGSPQDFIERLDATYEQRLAECNEQDNCQHIVVESGHYITDVFEEDVRKYPND